MLVRHLATAAGLVVLGATSAVAGVAVHGRWWGLLLALVAASLVLVALPAGWWSRLAFAAGWAATVGVAVMARPEGDFLIAGDRSGYALLIGSVVLVVAASVTLPPRRARPRADDEGSLRGAS